MWEGVNGIVLGWDLKDIDFLEEFENLFENYLINKIKLIENFYNGKNIFKFEEFQN
jgi:hypothetical protein